jgi:Glyoxalase-like domain
MDVLSKTNESCSESICWSDEVNRNAIRPRRRSPWQSLSGPESIIDPEGKGPRIWFHAVPELKICKNRLHFDLGVSGCHGVPLDIRRDRVEAEAARLVKIGATRLETLETEGLEHYAVAMADPEDNEFDIN